jgi:hypothetical protein
MSTDRAGAEEVEKKTGISGAPMVVAIIALLIWAGFLVVMLSTTDANETQWARTTYLFASVEAIAFAAAGALFGVSVQRERVKSAEETAKRHERDAANGRALAIATIADEGADEGADDENPEAYAFDPGAAPTDVRQRHAALARRLFPDLP